MSGALNNPELIWTTGGAAPWFGETADSYDGVSAAQSGLIGSQQQSWLQCVTTNLAQTSEVSFWWSVSSQAPDGLTFSIDGGTVANISGEAVGWRQYHAYLLPGSHTLLWTYSKGVGDNPTGIPFSDAGWVDQVVISPAGSGCVPPPSGIVAWWPGNGSATNIMGTASGLETNGAGYADGFVGEAFDFNGNTQAIAIPYSAALDLGQMAAWTIEAWIQPVSFNNVQYPTIFAEGNWGASLGLNSQSGALESWINDGTPLDSTSSVVLNQWNHVALVDDGATRTLYINGIPAGVGTAPAIAPDGNDAAIGTVGTFDGRSGFDGLIDEVSIYNRALSSNELSAIYNAGIAGKCTNDLPPVVLEPPQSQLAAVGQSMSLFAKVNGSSPLSFQWQFNGTNVFGASADSLVLSNLTVSQGGAYTLVVGNPYGTVTSYVAQVSMAYPLNLGQTVSSNVPFSGDGNLLVPSQVDNYEFTVTSQLACIRECVELAAERRHLLVAL